MKWTFTTGDFVRITLFAAIIAVLGIIPGVNLPFGVPVSFQSLGIMLAGVVLGPRLGFFAVALLVLIVLFGVPVLSGGRGGLGVLVRPTAGFFLGWLPAVLVTGWLYKVLPLSDALTRAIVASIVGCIFVLYLCGIPVMSLLIEGMTLDQAFMASLIFIPFDVVKAVAVGFIARMLERRNLI